MGLRALPACGPDVMTVAKGLGGGLPIGALVTSPEHGDVFAPGDHGSTFAGNPLAPAAANAALDVLDDPALLEHVDEMGALLAEGLRELPRRAVVRGRGLMVAAEVDGDAPELARRALLEQALVINATGPGTLRFLPPLVVRRRRSARRSGGWGALAWWMTSGCRATSSARPGAHAEPLGDPLRRDVLGVDQRDQPVGAELAPGVVIDARAASVA